MWSRMRSLAIGAVISVAACGGLRPEPSRPPSGARSEPRLPPLPNGGAHAARTPAAPATRAPASEASEPSEPAPSAATVVAPDSFDAWAAYAVRRQERDRGFEADFPLHGLAFHVQAQIFADADAKSLVIGYMRRGARFRAAESAPGAGCSGRWHALPDGGHVCTALGFMIERSPPAFEPLPEAASTESGLPYRYGKVLAADVPQYFRLPTAAEADASRTFIAALTAATPVVPLAADGPLPPAATPALPDPLRLVMQPGFYVSLDRQPKPEPSALDAADFTRTVRGAVIASAVLSPVEARPAPGVALDDALQLPIGFVYRPRAKLSVSDSAPSEPRQAGELTRLAAIGLDAAHASTRAESLLTRDGRLLRRGDVRVAERAARPALVPAGARWIHVRLSEQTLVAYEGNRAVFATLVASGQPGFDTPTGLFRVHAKHLSTTMDGSAGTDEVYSIEDVPWTMYFEGNYALHGAFWHDRFGQVRSHGCVNLAPEDARWLFRWTTPLLPAGWHGVVAARPNIGTWVFIEA
jgi:hypothetical protein